MTSSKQNLKMKSSSSPRLAMDDLTKDPEKNDSSAHPLPTENEQQDDSDVRVKRRIRPDAFMPDSNFRRKLRLEYTRVRKVVWFFVIAACTSICVWQMTLRILHYLREPTLFQVRIERLHQVQFPAITICPAIEPFHGSDSWNQYTLKTDDITARSSCDENNVCNFIDGVNINLKTSVSRTLWGECVTLTRDAPITYRGASTYIEIVLRPGIYGEQRFERNVAAQVFFHDPEATRSHESFMRADFWSMGRDTLVHLTLKKFDFLNTSRNPCEKEAIVIKCRNRCIDDKLDSAVDCSLPFIKTKWPTCQTEIQAKLTSDKIRDFYYSFNTSDCACMRQCQESVYTANMNTAGQRLDNSTAIRLQYADNLVEKAYEEYAYSFSALVSDLGGCLGIFLGLSIISFLKNIEKLLQGLKKKN